MQATLHIQLKKGEEKSFRRGNPWIFRHQLAHETVLAQAEPGAIAQLLDARGAALGIGLLSPNHLVVWRELQRGVGTALPLDWVETRLITALQKRQKHYDVPYFRLIHSEADGFPGLVIDRFDQLLVVQIGTSGMERLWPQIETALLALLPGATILLRNDIAVRSKEGLPQANRVIGDAVPARITLEEYGVHYYADPWHDAPPGWRFDQRDNRALAALHAKDKRVADIFCHSGGFGIAAAVAGAAEVLMIDSSAAALALAKDAAQLNHIITPIRTEQGDAYTRMEELAEAGEKFGLVILDPPALIPTHAHLPQGLRHYARTTRLGAMITAPGGILMMASHSPYCPAYALRKAVQDGIKAAGKHGKIIKMTGASADHPLHPRLPQSAYLHCAWARID
jgi:23S rRNA (cytosine1962-C5)-methyltransferase